MEKVKTVKQIREFIDPVMLPGYTYRTNFSCKEFLSSKEVSYDEIEMIHRIMQILKDNEKFVLSRFKKYTVEEYKEEERIRKEQSDKMFESLKQMIMVGRP